MSLLLIPLLITSLYITIVSQSLHQTFIYDTNPQYYIGLNNEFPELIPSIHDLPLQDDVKRLTALTHIIGHLPFAEQVALFKSFQSPGLMFNPADYFTSIRSPDIIQTQTDSAYDYNIFTDNSKSVSSYLTESVKRLNKGLGCLKRVLQKYGHSTNKDLSKISYAYKAMNDILRAQTQANICSAIFYETLQGIMIKRRSHLFDISNEHINVNQEKVPADFSPSDKLVYTDDKYRTVVGIAYDSKDKDEIVKSFKVYATCQHSYKNIIGRRAMEIQMQIGQFKSCLDRENPNPYAGNSSMTLPSASITYNRYKEQIGVNNASMIRTDQRTSNNYLLNFGFELGKEVLYDDKVVVAGYPKLFNKEWFDVRLRKIEEIITGGPPGTVTQWVNVKKVIMMVMTPNAKHKPMGNLHGVLLNSEGIAINNDMGKVDELIRQLKAFDGKDQVNASDNGIYECIPESECSCSIGTCPLDITGITNLMLHDMLIDNKNFAYESIALYVIHIQSLPPMLITKAYSTITGDVFDIYSQGQSIGNLTMSTIQSCFGVFTSGAKNDKDACRHVIRPECGHDLDYQCKKSGLYDYINEHPVSHSVLPYNCSRSNDECFTWIDKHFILGTIAVKSSGFAAYDLNTQVSMKQFPNKNEDAYYRPAKVVNNYPYNNVLLPSLEALLDDTVKKEMIYVYKSSSYTYIEDIQTVEGEKELVSIMVMKGERILLRGWLMVVMVICLVF